MYNAIGKSLKRKDSTVKATGTCKYVGDLSFKGMLYAKILRSPFPHANIIEIDCSDAEKVSGVVKIITGEQLDEPIGVAIKDQYPLAKSKVRFAGEPVVGVVGVSEKACKEALKKIKVTYEELPFVIMPKDAVKEDSPIIHENFKEYKIAPYVYAEGENIYHHQKIRKGDVKEAFEKSYIVIEEEFYSPYIQHVQLEPHCAIAIYNYDNSMTMYATTQAPFVVQHCISELHNIPINKVQVIAPYIGGGFGGKSDVTIEPLVSCLAKAVPGHYIKLQLSREEVFQGTNVGRGASCRYKLGVSKEGQIIGLSTDIYLGSGGYADYAINVVGGMAMAATGPYEIPNLKVDAFGVYTNCPPVGAMRGYGHPEVHLAMERMIDIAADKLGITPYDIRMKNILVEGKINGIGQKITNHNGRVDLCIKKVYETLFNPYCCSDQPHKYMKKGYGIAAYMKTPVMPSNVQSGASFKLNGDGTVTLQVGAIEMGQGTYTALAQIAAEALDIDVNLIDVVPEVDTLKSPYEWQTVASHTTWGVGNAIILAAKEFKKKIKSQASRYFECTEDDVLINGNQISCDKTPRILTFKDMSLGLKSNNGKGITTPLSAEAYFVASHITSMDKETGQGEAAADWTFGCIGVEVSINTLTGEVTVNRLINAIDAGKIINPQIAEDQVIGGMVMALGGALCEKLIFSEEGKIRNSNLVDYKTPGYEDMPINIEVYFVETPEETGPFGARGLGEHGAVAVAPAILNAIKDAIGINFYQLPVTAENIINAIEGRK